MNTTKKTETFFQGFVQRVKNIWEFLRTVIGGALGIIIVVVGIFIFFGMINVLLAPAQIVVACLFSSECGVNDAELEDVVKLIILFGSSIFLLLVWIKLDQHFNTKEIGELKELVNNIHDELEDNTKEIGELKELVNNIHDELEEAKTDVEQISNEIQDMKIVNEDNATTTMEDENGEECYVLNEKKDKLLFDVAKWAIECGNGLSTAAVQRHFSVGYSRAGKIVDQLFGLGLCTRNTGNSKPRTMLIDMEQLEELERSGIFGNIDE
jgi:DNA segregation ATPase FtsK/SpoIIIE-like protein